MNIISIDKIDSYFIRGLKASNIYLLLVPVLLFSIYGRLYTGQVWSILMFYILYFGGLIKLFLSERYSIQKIEFIDSSQLKIEYFDFNTLKIILLPISNFKFKYISLIGRMPNHALGIYTQTFKIIQRRNKDWNEYNVLEIYNKLVDLQK